MKVKGLLPEIGAEIRPIYFPYVDLGRPFLRAGFDCDAREVYFVNFFTFPLFTSK